MFMSSHVDKVKELSQPEGQILSRGQLQMIEEDPSNMDTLARLMGAVNLDNLFRAMQDPNVNLSAKIEFQKMLNKMGRLEPNDKADLGVGPQVVINITRAKNDEGIVIEGSSSAVAT